MLIDKKERGGFGLPDHKIYYEAACFAWLKDWFLLRDNELLDLEGFDLRYGWHAYLHYGKYAVHKDFTSHIIRNALFKTWEKFKRLLEPKTPKWLSPVEAKALKRRNMRTNWPTYNMLLIEDEGELKLRKYDEIKDQLGGWLDYHQLHGVFQKDKKTGFVKETTRLETDLIKNNHKVIAKMYQLLLEWEVMEETVKSSMVKWAQDIGRPIMMREWEHLWRVSMNFTTSSNIKENMMKIQHRWYLTPSKLSKIYKGTTNVCWRCGGTNGDLFHMWWICQKIKTFWGFIES